MNTPRGFTYHRRRRSAVRRITSSNHWRRRLGLEVCDRFALALLALLAGSLRLHAAEPPQTIAGLLADGWEIAGYASGYDNRTSLILFRHPGVNALVQCGVLFDVTRVPRTVLNCYELK
jgi:hypothetical protein